MPHNEVNSTCCKMLTPSCQSHSWIIYKMAELEADPRQTPNHHADTRLLNCIIFDI